jgi:hypothetical protein
VPVQRIGEKLDGQWKETAVAEKLTVDDRAKKIYEKAEETVKEIAGVKKVEYKLMMRFAGQLKDLYPLFVEKKPGTKILGFANFKDCMEKLIEPLEHISVRSGWYALSIGRRLLAHVTQEQAEELGSEKAKSLARVIKSKGSLPEGMLDHARTTKAKDLKVEVDVMLYKGNSQHDDGPMTSMTLTAGVKLLKSITDQINALRPAVTEAGAEMPASDAQVVEFALADCLSGIEGPSRTS